MKNKAVKIICISLMIVMMAAVYVAAAVGVSNTDGQTPSENTEGTQNPCADGHTFGDWILTKEATCEETGNIERTCMVCGEKEITVLSTSGHDYGEWTKTKEASCSEDGEQIRKCLICGEEETEVIPKLGHSFSNWVYNKAPDCENTGLRNRKCSVCGFTEEQEIAPLGHKLGEKTLVSESTISFGGFSTAVCETCNKKINIPEKCTAKVNGVSFSTDEGSFEDGTEIEVVLRESVEKKEDNRWFKFEVLFGEEPEKSSMERCVGDISEEYTVYDINALCNGDKVQPQSKVYVAFPIPENYGNNIAVYYITESFGREKLPITIDSQTRTVSVELNHFSNYVIVNLDKAPQPVRFLNVPENALYITCGALFVSTILFLILFIAKKPKTKYTV